MESSKVVLIVESEAIKVSSKRLYISKPTYLHGGTTSPRWFDQVTTKTNSIDLTVGF